MFLQTRSYRGSKFRGVSKNGSKWQVMIVRGNLKKYIGAIENEEVAGVLYDKYAIIIQGLQVSYLKALRRSFEGLTIGFRAHRLRRTIRTQSARFWSLSTGKTWIYIVSSVRKHPSKTNSSWTKIPFSQHRIQKTRSRNRIRVTNLCPRTSRDRCNNLSPQHRSCSRDYSAWPN